MARKQKPFIEQVFSKLGKRFKTSTQIAEQLGLVDDNGEATHYGKAKVRKALQDLAAAGRAKHEGSFRTSRYTRA